MKHILSLSKRISRRTKPLYADMYEPTTLPEVPLLSRRNESIVIPAELFAKPRTFHILCHSEDPQLVLV